MKSQKTYLYQRVVKAKLFIDENYNDQIDLTKISESAHYSKFHFLRLFKELYDYSPNQYLTFVRLNKAKLLLKTDISVAETCDQIGFESIPSFSNAFKKQTGLSPAKYRNQQLLKKEEIKQQPLKYVPNCLIEGNDLKKSNFQ